MAARHGRPNLSRLVNRFLLVATVLVTLGGIALVVDQLRRERAAWGETMLQELQVRAISIVARTSLVGSGLEAVARELADRGTATEDPPGPVSGCRQYTAADPCLAMTLRVLQDGLRGSGLRWIAVRDGDGRVTTDLGDPPPDLAQRLDRAAALARAASPGYAAPHDDPVRPGAIVGLAGVGMADGVTALAAFSLDDLWSQTFPLAGPANEVVLLAPDGRIIVRGGALPGSGSDAGALFQGSDPASLLRSLAGRTQRVDGQLMAAMALPDSGWVLLARVQPRDLAIWLLDRNRGLVLVAAGAICFAWGLLIAVSVFVIRPAQRLDRLLDETLANLQTTFDHLPEGVCLAGPDGRIIAANDRLALLVGEAGGTATKGLPVDRIWTGLGVEGTPATAPYVSLPPRDVRLVQGDTWLELQLAAVDGGRMLVVVVADIGERKEAELALRRARDEAEAAYRQVREAQAKLVQQEKLASLGQLVAGVAHEINTPLGVALTGATHLMQETRATREAAEGGTLKRTGLSQYFGTAEKLAELLSFNLSRAATLVDSFKKVAVDRTVDDERAIDYRSYIDDVVNSLRPMTAKSRVAVTVEGESGLVGRTQPGLLGQIVTNLVQNAVLHAFEGVEDRRVAISIHGAAGPAGRPRVRIAVADTGIGMPEDVRAKAFEPFFTTKRNAGGTGLGLHIVHNTITGALQGEIELRSTPGTGTSFTIFLPLNLQPDAAARGAAKGPDTSADASAGQPDRPLPQAVGE